MKPAKTNKHKKHYYIMLHGRYAGESWAVSPEKARNNFWWNNIKHGNEFSPRDYDPKDFDVVEA